MIFLAFWVVALIGALIHVSISRLWRQPLQRARLLLLYQLAISLGLTGCLGFAGSSETVTTGSVP